MKAHAGGVLYPTVAEPTPAENGAHVARPGAAVAERVEGGDPGTHQGSRLDRRQLGRHQRDRGGGGNHILPVAAVEGDAADLAGDAREELPAAARLAMPAIAA